MEVAAVKCDGSTVLPWQKLQLRAPDQVWHNFEWWKWAVFLEKAAIQFKPSKSWLSLAGLINCCPENFQICIQLFLSAVRPDFFSRCYILWIVVIYCSFSSTGWIADTFSHVSEVYICQICMDIYGVGFVVLRFFCYISNCIGGGEE